MFVVGVVVGMVGVGWGSFSDPIQLLTMKQHVFFTMVGWVGSFAGPKDGEKSDHSRGARATTPRGPRTRRALRFFPGSSDRKRLHHPHHPLNFVNVDVRHEEKTTFRAEDGFSMRRAPPMILIELGFRSRPRMAPCVVRDASLFKLDLDRALRRTRRNAPRSSWSSFRPFSASLAMSEQLSAQTDSVSRTAFVSNRTPRADPRE